MPAENPNVVGGGGVMVRGGGEGLISKVRMTHLGGDAP